MSFIGEQPHGGYKDWLIKVRKTLDEEDFDMSGDELDRYMRSLGSNLRNAYEQGVFPASAARAIRRGIYRAIGSND